jgi:hypothetical protein
LLELSQEFFDTLAVHAVPLDHRALGALKHSALSLDLYTWLAHRLCRVRKPGGVKLSWDVWRQSGWFSATIRMDDSGFGGRSGVARS